MIVPKSELVLVLTGLARLVGLASEPTSDIKKEPYGSTTLLLTLLIYLTRKKQKRVKKKKRI